MAEDKKKRVAILFGGRSVEHEISIITALEALEAIDRERYEPIPVYIDVNGKWFTGNQLTKKEFYRELPRSLANVREVVLLPIPGVGGLRVIDKPSAFSFFSAKNETIPIDVYLPAFHGRYGEDGAIQGLFELANVTFTGCGVLASAVAMDKHRAKLQLSACGVPILPGTLVSKEQAQRNIAKEREKICSVPGLDAYPLFVKPLHLGSSVGIGKARDAAELDAALANVFRYDSVALVERCVEALLEINVSVIEGESGPEASVVEVPVASDQILTYEDKYLRGGKGKGKGKGAKGGRSIAGMAGLTRVVDPEDLDVKLKDQARKYALMAFSEFDCAGLVRFDFIVDTNLGELYFNELNPLPGSFAYYLWAKSKPSLLYTELLSRIIEGAVNRKDALAGLQTEFGFRAMFQ